MKPDLSWLLGRRVRDIVKNEFSWCFVLDDESAIFTESAWRLTTTNGIAVVSEDDGHAFGLPAPVEAAARVKSAVAQSPVIQWDVRERTNDLVLCFSNDTSIEFLNLSCGYEGWQATHGLRQWVCTGSVVTCIQTGK